MVAVKGTTVKKQFKDICDRAFRGEVFIISRPKDENVVLVSASEYERLRGNAEYLDKIDRAIAQREAGTMQEHE